MEVLGVGTHETWMVGDNLEWEIVAPQRLGVYAIWHDGDGVGLPHGSPIHPDRIIRCSRRVRACVNASAPAASMPSFVPLHPEKRRVATRAGATGAVQSERDANIAPARLQ